MGPPDHWNSSCLKGIMCRVRKYEIQCPPVPFTGICAFTHEQGFTMHIHARNDKCLHHGVKRNLHGNLNLILL